ncbi:MAG: glycolate oxidase subunit GlcD [Pseudomonadota bacterium]|jgi:glycolate oxidase
MEIANTFKNQVIQQLSEVLPADAILSNKEDLRPYECDGLTAYQRLPLAVVLPTHTEQIQQIVQVCRRFGVPIVARGAGTGLSGGALPHEDGIILSLARLNRILEIDTQNLQARVQPGVRNLAISQAVDAYGLFYAPDPSSQVACTIGGNVAENAGGVHCLKYGLTIHNLIQIKVVTIEGELLTIGSDTLDTSAGCDLLSIMTGSEGMLGIVVEVVVKLTVKPETIQVLMAAFDSLTNAGEAVAAIISAGIIPAGLEMMDNPAIRAAEAFANAGYPTQAAAILLCELDGSELDVAEQTERVNAILKKYRASHVHVAKTASERAKLWAGRKSAFPAVGRISPDYYCMDGTIPRKHLAEVLQHISELAAHYELRVANVFHAGDGNLHPLILYDANRPGELEKAERFGADILALCVKVGGSITGEHGVGYEKLDSMCVQFGTAELEIFHAIKHAFDPNALLNPGKAVPTLHRCAELGAMHVHHGQLSHPELPRF